MINVKVSIIVPNFNHAHYLPTCLNGILAQKTLPHEVILIDDGSQDDSLKIMQQYATQSKIFKILENKINLGINKSVNNAFKQITGTHVLVMAADDWMMPDLLMEAYALLNKYPDAGFWSSGSWIIYEDDISKLHPVLMNYPIKAAGFIEPDLVKELLYKHDSWFAGNTVIHNIKHFNAEGGYDPSLKSFADGMLYRVMASKYGCCFTPRRLGVWRIRRDSHSQVCSNQVDTLLQITERAMHRINHDLHGVFPDKLKTRIHQRLLFSTAKIIWEQDNFSPRMDALIKNNSLNLLPYRFSKFILRCIDASPWQKKILGKMLLLANFKPFDIFSIIRSNLRQRFNIGV